MVATTGAAMGAGAGAAAGAATGAATAGPVSMPGLDRDAERLSRLKAGSVAAVGSFASGVEAFAAGYNGRGLGGGGTEPTKKEAPPSGDSIQVSSATSGQPVPAAPTPASQEPAPLQGASPLTVSNKTGSAGLDDNSDVGMAH